MHSPTLTRRQRALPKLTDPVADSLPPIHHHVVHEWHTDRSKALEQHLGRVFWYPGIVPVAKISKARPANGHSTGQRDSPLADEESRTEDDTVIKVHRLDILFELSLHLRVRHERRSIRSAGRDKNHLHRASGSVHNMGYRNPPTSRHEKSSRELTVLAPSSLAFCANSRLRSRSILRCCSTPPAMPRVVPRQLTYTPPLIAT